MWLEYLVYRRVQGYYIPDIAWLIIRGPAGTAEQQMTWNRERLNGMMRIGWEIVPIPVWHLPDPEWLSRWLDRRTAARAAKNHRLGDAIRRGFARRGITLRDTRDGTVWAPEIVLKQEAENAAARKRWDAWETSVRGRPS